ncbi:hypothetical protein DAEQUDRAFT_813426 [Daedalea quercina L-15889]|uniref:ABC transporter domain-containing protein n=1 Tax=Daedalea quercina L-15889 TaxID=1314783 RepID=A0A165N7R2_9APHY|nr:hypothetical protein DAEQUDRAFT_813426 [Daedalea quercina L-15889]
MSRGVEHPMYVVYGTPARARALGTVKVCHLSIHAPLKPTRRLAQIRKVVPAKSCGVFELGGATFAYPSRPTLPVLQDIPIFLPSNEMPFIVGSSGSGKSTIAQLLLHMYATAEGVIRFDDQDLNYLDEDWMCSHVVWSL